MTKEEAEAVNSLLRWVLKLPSLDGSPVSDERGCEAAFTLTRRARQALGAGLGPEQLAGPLGEFLQLKHPLHYSQERRAAIVADVPAAQVIQGKGILNGAATLAGAAQKAREFADWLHYLADAGYELDGPVEHDYGFYSKPQPGTSPRGRDSPIG